MKLATVVVCYHPDDKLIQNVASYSGGSDFIYVWDNTPGGSEVVGMLKNVTMMHHDHQNMGLAFAYNRAIEEAEKDGATHLMTMDQDSCFEDFRGYRQWVETSQHIGISAIVFNPSMPAKEQASVITWAGQSGSIFPLDMMNKIGPFREDLFIGMVDAEICLRAQEKGYNTIRYNNSGLIHKVGSQRKVRFLGHSVMVSDYNALRHYYDSRNRILMWHEFPYDYNFKGKACHLIGRFKIAVKILFFEKNKWSKISAIIRGTYYGFQNKAVPYKKTVGKSRRSIRR